MNFANPDASSNGHRTVASGLVAVKSIKAGEKGNLIIDLPKSFIKNDALIIEVYDNQGRLVYDKRLPITEPKNTFRVSTKLPFTQSKTDSFKFTRGKITLHFDENSGILMSVLDKGKATSLANFPFLIFEADDMNLKNENTQTAKATVSKKGDVFIIEAKNTKGFDYIKWLLKPNGEILLDYAYTLNSGKYHYAGIGIEVAAKDVKRKRWLGEGPWRIYQNRQEGGLLDVYAIDKKINKPGQIYNGPEFEGFFAPWNWAVFYLDKNINLGFKNKTNVTLGVLNPINGFNPKKATWHYPSKKAFSFLM